MHISKETLVKDVINDKVEEAWEDVQKLIEKYPTKSLGVALAIAALIVFRNYD